MVYLAITLNKQAHNSLSATAESSHQGATGSVVKLLVYRHAFILKAWNQDVTLMVPQFLRVLLVGLKACYYLELWILSLLNPFYTIHKNGTALFHSCCIRHQESSVKWSTSIVILVYFIQFILYKMHFMWIFWGLWNWLFGVTLVSVGHVALVFIRFGFSQTFWNGLITKRSTVYMKR